MRWALLVATVPIAIGANGIRVAIPACCPKSTRKLAQAHIMREGYIVFIVALVALIVTHRVIKLVCEEVGTV